LPNVTIYLPADLAAEAKAAKLSLSSIAQRAIREELTRMQAKHVATGDLEAVAARLRSTLDEEELMQEQEGRTDGATWAREYATAAELRWLVEHFEPGRGGDFDHSHSITAFFSAKDREHVTSVGHQDNAYWHGFVDGARGVLEAVEPLL
jgi:post-segregation antitoxin (ccd killing protein)